MKKLAAALAIALAAVPAWADVPRRIVSFNLCADQLVVALADSGQIAALSPYAHDRQLSVVAERARRFPTLDWSAESTVALGPDLVLVGPNDRRETRRMLANLNIPVVDVAHDDAGNPFAPEQRGDHPAGRKIRRADHQ